MATSESIKEALQALEDEAAWADNLARCFALAAGGDETTGHPAWVYELERIVERFSARVEAMAMAIHGVSS